MPRTVADRRLRAPRGVAVLEGTGTRSVEWYAATTVVVLTLGAVLVGRTDPRLLTATALVVAMFGLLRLQRAVTESAAVRPGGSRLRR
jgi:hypothetical protein